MPDEFLAPGVNVLRGRYAAIAWVGFIASFVALTSVSIAKSGNAKVTFERPYAAQRDAADVIWAPAKALLANENPYDVEAFRAAVPEARQDFVGYLPHHVTIHLVFGFAPRAPALALFATSSLMCLILTAVLGAHHAEIRQNDEQGFVGIICAMTLLSAPGALTVWLGQTSFEVALGAALLATKRRSLQIAGALLVTQKPHIGVVILGAWTLAGRINIRRVAAAFGFAAMLTLPVAAVAGGPWQLFETWVNGLMSHSDAPGDVLSRSTTRTDTWGLLARLTGLAAPTIVQLGLLLLVTVGLAVVLRRTSDGPRAIALATVGAAVIGVAHPYSLAAAIPAVGVWVAQSKTALRRLVQPGLFASLASLIALGSVRDFRTIAFALSVAGHGALVWIGLARNRHGPVDLPSEPTESKTVRHDENTRTEQSPDGVLGSVSRPSDTASSDIQRQA